MPVLAGQDQGAALLRAQGVDLVNGVGTDGLFHRLTFPVEVAQLPGQFLRPGGIIRFQQVGGQIRGPHAPGGVDAGGEDKADLNGGDGLAGKPGLFEQGVNAHEVCVGQSLQPAVDDGAVFPLHPHDIGNGADGGQGAVPGEQGVLPALSSQGQHQLQCHAHACQVLEGVGAVRPVGIYHCHRMGQVLLALMMVRYHHIHTQRGGVFHLVVAGDAAVHRHHQRGALVIEPPDGVPAEAVAVLDAAGDIPQAPGAAAAQIVG